MKAGLRVSKALQYRCYRVAPDPRLRGHPRAPACSVWLKRVRSVASRALRWIKWIPPSRLGTGLEIRDEHVPLLPGGRINIIYRLTRANRQCGDSVGYLRKPLEGRPRYTTWMEFSRFLRSYQRACQRMAKRAANAGWTLSPS
jgi:hypothetical protein